MPLTTEKDQISGARFLHYIQAVEIKSTRESSYLYVISHGRRTFTVVDTPQLVRVARPQLRAGAPTCTSMARA
jgi:hypothetical protein